MFLRFFFFFKQKTAYEMRISDWSSDVCSSDLVDDPKFRLLYGDMTDATNLIRLIQETQPDEIYNLAAQSHVQVSFETPEYTANADALGTLRILEAIRILKLEERTRFYQASTSELYGKAQEIPQNEKTPFYPRSPYAAAKLYAYWITVNYREARSAERRVGKECVSKCRYRWSPEH